MSSATRRGPETLSQAALQPDAPVTEAESRKKPFYTSLSFQVLFAILLALVGTSEIAAEFSWATSAPREPWRSNH